MLLIVFPADQPEIIIPPENITILPNHSCTLDCLAFSSGMLTYDWSRHGSILPETAVGSYTHKTFINSHSDGVTLVYNLVFNNVQMSDEGWYCCTATNEGSSTIKCAWLEVNSKLVIAS